MCKAEHRSGQKQFDADTYHINDLNSFASSTPAVDADHVYVMWLQRRTNRSRRPQSRRRGSLAARRRAVQGATRFRHLADRCRRPCLRCHDSEARSAITAFDRRSGEVRWRLPREAGTTAFATPCLLDPTATAETAALHQHRVRPDCHRCSYRQSRVARFERRSRPALRQLADRRKWNGSCRLRSGRKRQAADRRTTGRRARRRKKSTDFSKVFRKCRRRRRGRSAVRLEDRGIVSCYDLATGKQYWRERIGGDFHSSPIRIGNRIFCVSSRGRCRRPGRRQTISTARPQFT